MASGRCLAPLNPPQFYLKHVHQNYRPIYLYHYCLIFHVFIIYHKTRDQYHRHIGFDLLDDRAELSETTFMSMFHQKNTPNHHNTFIRVKHIILVSLVRFSC